MSERRRTWLTAAVIVAAVVAYEVPQLLSDRLDMEQYDYEYYSAFAQMKDVLSAGVVNFWQDSLGFGSPLPIGFNLAFHPLIFLNTMLPDRVVTFIFQAVHLSIALIYLNALLVRFATPGAVRAVALLIYLLGPPTFHYHYVEDWPVAIIITGLVPVIVFYIEKTIGAATARERWRYAIIVGLVLAAQFVWGHPSVCVLSLLITTVYGLFRAGLPPPPALVGLGLVAGVIVAAIYAPEAARVIRHAVEFDPSLPKYAGPGYNVVDWFAWSLWPFDVVDAFGLDLTRFSDLYRSPRSGFFTCLFLVVLAGAIARVTKWRWRTPHDAAVAASAAFLVAFTLSNTSPETFANMFSATWIFRDPAVFFALIVYAAVATRAWHAVSQRPFSLSARTAAAAAVVVLSFVALGQAVYFAGKGMRQHLARSGQPYRGELADSGLFRELKRLFPGEGHVVYQSFEVEETLLRRGKLRSAGAFASSDFPRMGFANLVRRYFKTYSTDVFHDDAYQFYGHIPSLPLVIQSKPSLDFFGVSIVMVTEAEVKADDYPNIDRDLKYVGDYRVPDSGVRIMFYANPTPLPRALAFDPRTIPDSARTVPDIVMVAQWAPVIAAVKRDEPVQMTGQDGRYQLTLAPRPEPRLVLVKQWHRREWRARDENGSALTIVPLFKGFIGVEVPGGTSGFRLEYRPVLVQTLWVLSAVVAIGGGVAVVLLSRAAPLPARTV